MFTDGDPSLPTPRPRHLGESSQQNSVSLPSNIATRQRGRQTNSESIFLVKSELCEAMNGRMEFSPRDHFMSWFGSSLTCTKSDTRDPGLTSLPKDVARGIDGAFYILVLDEVKQLEDLKHSFGKTFSVLKQHSSVYSDVNGQREGHSETREEVKSDGKLLARVDQKMDSSQAAEGNATPATRVRTELEVPSRGIHKTMVEQQTTENGNRRSVPHDPGNSVEKYIPYSGVQYSPLDMAEYVFWTGDEKGVTLAIEEFLQEGLMAREEAINFLQEIKLNLEYLQNHYSQQRLHKQEEQQAKERAALIQKALGLDKPRAMSEPKNSDLSSESLLDKKSSADVPVTNKEVAMLSSNRVQQQNVGLSDEDYEELLERLRVADFLYTEYSLEEVIYQLAKVMFSQSLTRGSAEAQEALQKFTNFLEAEAEQGHISRSLEKKVLDVLIAALTDTLSEQPHLVNAAREGLAGSSSNQLLHQLLLLNPGGAAGEAVSAGSVAEAATSESHQSTLAKGRERQGDNTKTNKTT